MAAIVPWALLLTFLSGIPVARQLRHHPRGLWLLFFTEMWERFSYYGMRALLIFYLTEHFLLDDAAAQERYAAYTTLNYLLPLAGGLVGDRLLGARRAVAFGALLLVAGHGAMALEGPAARQYLHYQGTAYTLEASGRGEARQERLVRGDGVALTIHRRTDGTILVEEPRGPLPPRIEKSRYRLEVEPVPPLSQAIFHLALALIVVGVGFQKANMTALVGALYKHRPEERTQGFTLYMFGINIGAFWSSVLCGWLGMRFGWWAGFGAAGVGMAMGYAAFLRLAPLLGEAGQPPAGRESLRHFWPVALATVPVIALVWYLVQHFALVGLLLGFSTAAIALFLALFLWRQCDTGERLRTGLALALVLLAMVWTAFAEQTGSLLALFAERNSTLAIGSLAINAAQVTAFYMGFVLIAVPVLAGLWDWLGRRHADPAPITKFIFAFALQALAFALLGMSGAFADAGNRVPLALIVLALLLHAVSEMTYSPVGLAEMTRLAPARILSTLVAVWYLAISWGQWLGGLIARAAAAPAQDAAVSLPIYLGIFRAVAGGALIAMLATGLLAWWLRRRHRRLLLPLPD